MKHVMQTLLAGVLGALAAYLHALLVPLCVLAAVMLLDYGTGMAAAWSAKTLNSRVGAAGILKKVGYLALVAVGMVVDYLLTAALTRAGAAVEVNYCFGLMITVWLIINELISILENLGKQGIPLPDFLLKAIDRLRDSVDRRTK